MNREKEEEKNLTGDRTRCGCATMFVLMYVYNLPSMRISFGVYVSMRLCVCVSSLALQFFGILQYEVATTGWYNCVAVLTKRPTLKKKSKPAPAEAAAATGSDNNNSSTSSKNYIPSHIS